MVFVQLYKRGNNVIAFNVVGQKDALVRLSFVYEVSSKKNIYYLIPPLQESVEQLRKYLIVQLDNQVVAYLENLQKIKDGVYEIFQTDYDVRFEKLEKHQKQGIEFIKLLKNNYGFARLLLCDDPRLGKTYIAIHTIKFLEFPVLIMCPNIIINYWSNLCFEILGKDVNVLPIKTKLNRQNRANLINNPKNNQIIITNWETFSKSIDYNFNVYQTIICDEAHKLGNVKNKIYQIIKQYNSKNLLLLTATPTEKGAADWFPYLQLINKIFFSSSWRFYNWFCYINQNFFGTEVSGVKNEFLLIKLLELFVLRREIENVTNLPEKTFITIECNSYTKFDKFYDIIENETIISFFDSELTIPNKLAQFVRLRQFTSLPKLINAELSNLESPKILTILELIKIKKFRGKYLIFSNFVGILQELQEKLENINISSSVISNNYNDNVDVFLSTFQKGVGIDLSQANTIIFTELPVSSRQLRQCLERITNIYDTRPKTIVFLSLKPVDDVVIKMMQNKLKDVKKTTTFDYVVELMKRLRSNKNEQLSKRN